MLSSTFFKTRSLCTIYKNVLEQRALFFFKMRKTIHTVPTANTSLIARKISFVCIIKNIFQKIIGLFEAIRELFFSHFLISRVLYILVPKKKIGIL